MFLLRLINLFDTMLTIPAIQYNTDERPTPQKFLSIQASFPQSSFRSTFGNNPESPNSGPGVGRGNPFGAGGGGAFGQAGSWRGRR